MQKSSKEMEEMKVQSTLLLNTSYLFMDEEDWGLLPLLLICHREEDRGAVYLQEEEEVEKEISARRHRES